MAPLSLIAYALVPTAPGGSTVVKTPPMSAKPWIVKDPGFRYAPTKSPLLLMPKMAVVLAPGKSISVQVTAYRPGTSKNRAVTAEINLGVVFMEFTSGCSGRQRQEWDPAGRINALAPATALEPRCR